MLASDCHEATTITQHEHIDNIDNTDWSELLILISMTNNNQEKKRQTWPDNNPLKILQINIKSMGTKKLPRK